MRGTSHVLSPKSIEKGSAPRGAPTANRANSFTGNVLQRASTLLRLLLSASHDCLMDPHAQRFALGLTDGEVDRLREILRRTRGLELTREQAWTKAIQLLSLGLTILQVTSPRNGHGFERPPS